MSVHMFDIIPDARRSMLRITMRGHWMAETVQEYRVAVARAVATLIENGCKRERIVALVDAREVSAQSQDVIEEYQKGMVRDGRVPRRLATLLSSALFKRQVERIAMPNQRIFSHEHEALAWLLSSDEDA